MERDPGSGNGIDVLVIPNLLVVKEKKGGSLKMSEMGGGRGIGTTIDTPTITVLKVD